MIIIKKYTPLSLKFKNKKGSASSILFVLLAMTAITLITGFIDISKKVYALNEIQSIMDITSHNALLQVMDIKNLKAELFALDDDDYADNEILNSLYKENFKSYEKKIIDSYKNSLMRHVNEDDSFIQSFEIVDTNVEFYRNNWRYGLSNKDRYQLAISSITKVTIKANKEILTSSSDLSFFIFDNIQMGKNKRIEYNGVDSEGNMILYIKNATRLIYR